MNDPRGFANMKQFDVRAHSAPTLGSGASLGGERWAWRAEARPTGGAWWVGNPPYGGETCTD